MKKNLSIFLIVLVLLVFSKTNIYAQFANENVTEETEKNYRSDGVDLNTKNSFGDIKIFKETKVQGGTGKKNSEGKLKQVERLRNNKSHYNNKTYREGREILNLPMELDIFRPLSEINEINITEAYPWISSDGLRLYYTKEYPDSTSNIYYSERFDLGNNFSNMQPLNINLSGIDNMSCWLSSDELNIYFIRKIQNGDLTTTLFYSFRNSIGEEFTIPQEVDLIGDISGFLSGPSLTTDLNQLYIYNSTSDENILILDRTGENEFTLSDSLDIPDGYFPGPGSLSSNDSKYYFSLEESQTSVKQLYMYERENISDIFDSLYYIDNDQLNNPIFRNILPSVSNDGSFLVFTRNDLATWSGNDLYFASIVTTEIDDHSTSYNHNLFKNYPNPFNPTTTIKFNLENDSNVNLGIYNIKGQLVKELVNGNLSKGIKSYTWDGNNQEGICTSSGLYFYKLKVGGKLIAIKKMSLIK